MARVKSKVLAAAGAASCLALGWTGGAYSSGPPPEVANGAPKPVVHVPEAHEVSAAFVGVAERLAASVVRITTRQQASVPERSGLEFNPFEGTPFEPFFHDFGHAPSEPPGARQGMGSGVVIDDHGHILTNNHVVENATELKVTFIDGKELIANIVGTDPKTDLAVVRVDGVTTKPAEFGDAEHLRVGEWVMAIGNPFGLDHSVTVGVLSAKGRHGLAPGKLEDFLQTDASINPGNSGGPLVNLNGQIVGINTMIAGLGTGVGFAVSASIARPIAHQLIDHGKVKRPFVGIVMQSLTPELKQALGEKAPEKGAIVSEVQKGSPAERSGIHAGDVVVRVGGTPTTDPREVQKAVLDHEVGHKVDFVLWRDGKQKTVSVRTAQLPTEGRASTGPGDRERQLGLELETLTPEQAAQLGLEATRRGVLVAEADPDSPAVETGVRKGDVFTNIDGQPVATANEALDRLSQRRSGGHLVQVLRGDGVRFVVVPNPRKRE